MKRLLLDTHAALFWWAGSDKLGQAARVSIDDGDTPIFVSAASCWEIATKFRLGKLDFAGDPQMQVPRLIEQHGFKVLEVTAAHALQAGSLGGAHRDPFDRLIAAQALIEHMPVVTRDREIEAFGCEVIW